MSIPAHASAQALWAEYSALQGGVSVDRFYEAFRDATAEFAGTEGEGDGSLTYWREAHRAFYTRECERAGRAFSVDMAIACERFRVVHRAHRQSADPAPPWPPT